MKLTLVELTAMDNCLSYALKRIGRSDLISSIKGSDIFKEISLNNEFVPVDCTSIGCIVIWNGDIGKSVTLPTVIDQ